MEFSKIWNKIIDKAIDGNYDDKKQNQYETVDYGILYKNTLSKLIADKFGAKLDRKANGIGTLIFDLEKFQKFDELYRVDDSKDRPHQIMSKLKSKLCKKLKR